MKRIFKIAFEYHFNIFKLIKDVDEIFDKIEDFCYDESKSFEQRLDNIKAIITTIKIN